VLLNENGVALIANADTIGKIYGNIGCYVFNRGNLFLTDF